MPYGADPGTGTAAQRRDATRLRVGDTDNNSLFYTDAEYDFWLANASDGILNAALQAAQAIAAKFARQVAVTQGPASFAAQERVKAYLQIADDIRAELRRGGATFFAGGLTKSGKEALAEDTDAVQPSFEIGMDDYDHQDRDRLDRH